MLKAMPLRLFREWEAYAQQRPFGEEARDLRAAVVPFLFATVFSGKGARPRFEDFVLASVVKPRQRKTGEQIMALLKTIPAGKFTPAPGEAK